MTSVPASTGAASASPRRHGDGSRDEILDAAARLFTENGFAATSTRAIALVVGVRQASLYYHFPRKEQILAELLRRTVEPSLSVATALDRADTPATVRLHALATFDVRLLCSGRWNCGALYLLPEIRSPRFATFRSERGRLREVYARFVAEVVRDTAVEPADPTLADLVFALVESVIPARSEGRFADLDRLSDSIPDGCLRLLSVPPHAVVTARRRSHALLHELGQDAVAP